MKVFSKTNGYFILYNAQLQLLQIIIVYDNSVFIINQGTCNYDCKCNYQG